MDVSSTQDIAGLFRDVYRALQLYAEPIASHALQVYQSVLATAPSCGLTDHTRTGHIITPRLRASRTSHWNSVLIVIGRHTGAVSSVAYASDGNRIVSGSYDATVRMWDAVTGKQLALLKGHTDKVLSVGFSPDIAHIVSGSADKTIRVWDAHTGKPLAVFEGHTDWVRSVAFSPDGAQGEQLAVLEGHELGAVCGILARRSAHRLRIWRLDCPSVGCAHR
jgi:WD40 repeat protein